MTQEKLIRRHLEDGNTLTPIEALKLYGCFRLASVVYKLKAKGMDIVTHLEEHAGGVHANYKLRGNCGQSA